MQILCSQRQKTVCNAMSATHTNLNLLIHQALNGIILFMSSTESQFTQAIFGTILYLFVYQDVQQIKLSASALHCQNMRVHIQFLQNGTLWPLNCINLQHALLCSHCFHHYETTDHHLFKYSLLLDAREKLIQQSPIVANSLYKTAPPGALQQ